MGDVDDVCDERAVNGSGDRPSAVLSRVVSPGETPVFSDAGYGPKQSSNFLRAPSEAATYLNSGNTDYRHHLTANVCFADGHVKSVYDPAPDESPFGHHNPRWGELSQDDSAYGPGMKPCSAYPLIHSPIKDKGTL